MNLSQVTHLTFTSTLSPCQNYPGGGRQLGLNHAGMSVSKSEGNGFLFGFK